jgi:FAD/FMN-containing dehydrogenase
MRRRDFCRSALAAGTLAAIPSTRALAAAASAMTVAGSVRAVTGAGAEVEIEAGAVQELRDSLRGPLLMPGNAAYDDARKVWNAMIDKHPALIVQCEGASDVARAVSFARERDLLVAVRGGGHSISGKSVCEGGMMIDMSQFNSVHVDPRAKTARVDGGCLEGHIDRESAPFGLVTTAGVVSHTGAAGLTLGGGFGRVCRHFGMACDNVRRVDIVTADGTLRRASVDEHPDLYWALKGGGGNFGVVIDFEFELHEMNPTVIAGDIVWPGDQARQVLEFYGEHGNSLPDELNLNIALVATPQGEKRVSVEAVWSGDAARAAEALAPLRKVGKPIADTVAPVPYAHFQTRHDNANRHGIYSYMKSSFVNELSSGLIDEVLALHRSDGVYWIYFMQAGGAVSRIGPQDTAFPHRSAHSNMMVISESHEQKDRTADIAAVRSAWARLEPHTVGFYVNLMEADDGRTRANYGVNYERLVKVKNRYDPGNLFRLNANIKPTA